jgi:hypothetical protein
MNAASMQYERVGWTADAGIWSHKSLVSAQGYHM